MQDDWGYMGIRSWGGRTAGAILWTDLPRKCYYQAFTHRSPAMALHTANCIVCATQKPPKITPVGDDGCWTGYVLRKYKLAGVMYLAGFCKTHADVESKLPHQP